MRQTLSRSPLFPVIRTVAAVSVAALVAGCSSDTRRFGPAPWSSALDQHARHVGSSGGSNWGGQQQIPSSDVTGSLPAPQVQSQSLPPVSGVAAEPYTPAPQASAGRWTPPPPAHIEPPPAPVAAAPQASVPTPVARSGWTQGPAPAASRMPQRATAAASTAATSAATSATAAASAVRQAPAQIAQSGTHAVQRGESLVAIAQRYRVSPSELAAANQLGPSDTIRVGQQLTIPGRGQAARGVDPAPTGSIPARQAEPRQAPSRQVAVADPRPAPAPAPAQARAPAPAPVAERTPPQPARPVEQAQPAPAPQRQQQAQPAPQSAPAAESTAPVRTASANANANATASDTRGLPAPQSMTSTEFRWPVRGRVVTNFGRQPGGGSSDGIAIQVPAGTPVKAAENGVVAYAGNQLRGYGNLVLIRHEGDWVTAYAHNSELLVRRGETVRRGQTIAKAGQTGDGVRQPQVHFEIRRGSTPVNPVDHLTGS